MGLQVFPLNAQLGDSDRQPRRPLEGIPGRGVGTDKHAEARACDKGAAGGNREVPHFTTQFERTGLHLGGNRRHGNHIFTAGRCRVDFNVFAGDLEQAAEGHLHPIGMKLEPGWRAVAEAECSADGFCV